MVYPWSCRMLSINLFFEFRAFPPMIVRNSNNSSSSMNNTDGDKSRAPKKILVCIQMILQAPGPPSNLGLGIAGTTWRSMASHSTVMMMLMSVPGQGAGPLKAVCPSWFSLRAQSALQLWTG